MGQGLSSFLPAFDHDPQPEGFQLTDAPLRLRMDTAQLEDIFAKIPIARAT